MNARAIVPLIDLVFLTLGTLLVIFTRLEEVETIPVELAKVGSGAVANTAPATFVTLAEDGLYVGDRPVDSDALVREVAGRRVILTAAPKVSFSRAIALFSRLKEAECEVSLRVVRDPDAASTRR